MHRPACKVGLLFEHAGIALLNLPAVSIREFLFRLLRRDFKLKVSTFLTLLISVHTFLMFFFCILVGL